jgi:hypothetical protein
MTADPQVLTISADLPLVLYATALDGEMSVRDAHASVSTQDFLVMRSFVRQ